MLYIDDFFISFLFYVIMQESIAKQINENPEAGWKADINPRFSNHTVKIQLALPILYYNCCSYYFISIVIVRVYGKISHNIVIVY